MFKSNPGNQKDRHAQFSDSEIGIEELCAVFFCSPMTVSRFIKACGITHVRKSHQGKVYERESTISTLLKVTVNGKLSTDLKMICNKLKTLAA